MESLSQCIFEPVPSEDFNYSDHINTDDSHRDHLDRDDIDKHNCNLDYSDWALNSRC